MWCPASAPSTRTWGGPSLSPRRCCWAWPGPPAPTGPSPWGPPWPAPSPRGGGPAARAGASGGPLATALEGTAAAPGLAVEMLAVGEQTGNLQDMLINVSDFFGEEVETRLAGKAAPITPPVMLV